MKEEMPMNNYERSPDRVPTKEEVEQILERLAGGQDYREVRREEDEQGVRSWEIKLPAGGGHKEYWYKRGGVSPEGSTKESAVHITYFNEDGEPIGGTRVAWFSGSEWIIEDDEG